MLAGAPPFFSKNKDEMYDSIMNKPVKMRPHFSPTVCDLLRALMQADVRTTQPDDRLADATAVKRHPFFETINWELLANKRISPTFQPKVESGRDLRNFDREFTEEKAVDSYVDERLVRPHNKYQGFTYQEPSPL
jgi:hypothetical protein